MAMINFSPRFSGSAERAGPVPARQMKLAEALMQNSARSAPNAMYSTGEGVAHVADRALSGFLAGQARRDETAAEAEAGKTIASLLLGGGSPGGGASADIPAPGAEPASGPAQGLSGGGSDAPASQSFSGGQEEFVSQMMPYAMQVSEQTGIDPRIIIAQGALESGWGKSAPGNNYFGIKSHGKPGGQTLATNEVVNGQTQRINDSFRTFGGMGESVQGYGEFMRENPRYRPMMEAQGLDAQIQALGESGYATDPNYASKIRSIATGVPIPDMQANMPAQGAPQASGQQGIAQALAQLHPENQQQAEYASMPGDQAQRMGGMLLGPQATRREAGVSPRVPGAGRDFQNVEQTGDVAAMGGAPGAFGLSGPGVQAGPMGVTPRTPFDQASGAVEMMQAPMQAPQQRQPAPAPAPAPQATPAPQPGAMQRDMPAQGDMAAQGQAQPAFMQAVNDPSIDPDAYGDGQRMPRQIGNILAARSFIEQGRPVPERLQGVIEQDMQRGSPQAIGAALTGGGSQAPRQAPQAAGGGMTPQQGMPPAGGAPMAAQGAPQGMSDPDAILQEALMNPRTRDVAIQVLQQRQEQQQRMAEEQRSIQAAQAAGIDPRFLGNEQIAGAAASAQFRAPPTSVQEFEYGRENPDFFDQQLEQTRAGATVVNTGQPTDKFYETLDSSSAQSFSNMYDMGVSANSKIAQIDRLDSLLQSAPQGAVGVLKSAAGEFGIDTEGLSDIQAATAIINRLVPEQRAPGSGPMSDADLDLFKQSLPRIINQPGGNRMIIDTMRGIAEYERQQGQIAGAVLNRQMEPGAARSALMELENPLAWLNETEGGSDRQGARSGAPQISSDAEYDALPSGARFIDPEGNVRQKP